MTLFQRISIFLDTVDSKLRPIRSERWVRCVTNFDFFLCNVDEIPDGGGLAVAVGSDRELAVFLSDQKVFVADGHCTHNGAPLADEGYIEGCVIECTWHGARFDLRTGELLDGPCTDPLRVYECQVRSGAVFISSAMLSE